MYMHLHDIRQLSVKTNHSPSKRLRASTSLIAVLLDFYT